MRPQRAAYFDVDHTITRTGTLRSFLDFYAADPRGRRVAPRIPALEGAVAATRDRPEMHRLFVEAFAGETWSGLLAAGDDWLEGFAPRDGFNTPVVERIRQHQLDGDRVVFVSGSWLPCLAPLARRFGVTEVLCTAPVIVRDQLTGGMLHAMVGERKAAAVLDHASRYGVDRERSVAYGDDESDLPLLEAVGTAVVIGSDPVLLGWAERHPERAVALEAVPF